MNLLTDNEVPLTASRSATRWGNQLHKRRVNYPPTGGPLTREQKATLCILAREAFAQQPLTSHVSPLTFEEFRHTEVERATGKSGLTQCVQSDYLPLRAHFEDLCGRSDRAFNTHMRAETEPTRIAMMKLRSACRDAGLALEYAGKICRVQNKCTLDEASAKQLWRLVFTVRNRAPRKAENLKTETLKSEDPF